MTALQTVPLAARSHRGRIARERAALVARLVRMGLRRFKQALHAASRCRADAFRVGFSPAESAQVRDAARWSALARVLRELARARRVDLATVALVGRVADVGTNEELLVRAEFVGFLDAAADAAVARAVEVPTRRRDVATPGDLIGWGDEASPDRLSDERDDESQEIA